MSLVIIHRAPTQWSTYVCKVLLLCNVETRILVPPL